METYIVRIIDSRESQFNGYINVDENDEIFGEAIEKNSNSIFSLSGFLTKDKLNLNILSKEENILVEASRSDSFPKRTISIESNLFFGKPLDMCDNSLYIELTNIELLEMMPGSIKVDGFLVKFADLLDADRPKVWIRSEFDSDIPDVIPLVAEEYRKKIIHTEDSFAYKYCMSRQQQKQVKKKRKEK